MKFVIGFFHKISDLCGLLGVIALLLMAFHIFFDVILRTISNNPIPATEEIVTRYYMVTIAILPLAWVERYEKMIAVEVFNRLFNDLIAKWLKIGSAGLCAFVYAAFFLATWNKAFDQYEIGSYVMSLDFPMPVWPTYFLPTTAFGLATVVVVIRIFEILKPSLHKV